ncbi:LisH domain-containing protein armc9 [Paramecium bursaria]
MQQPKKPQTKQEVRAKVNSGLNRKKPETEKKRIGEKSVQSQELNDGRGNLQENLNNIVQDYLLRHQYFQTLDSFQKEMEFRVESENQGEKIILSHFDRGDREQFFNSWSRYIPQSSRQDHESWKLEFYIQIYFLINEIHPIAQRKTKIDKQAVNAFKAFLESKGSDLSRTNEVLTYFSLPYVPNPQMDSELRDRVKEYIQGIYGQDQNGSLLRRLYLGQNLNQGNLIDIQDYAQQLATTVKQLQQENQYLKKKVQQQTGAIALAQKFILNSSLVYHQQLQQSVEELMPLDYQKIIKLFTSSTNHILVANVLQALRWRITKARSNLERRSVVVAFATHDIIGTHQKNILLAQYLMLKSHQKISVQTLKLLNALASDYSGRTYLTSNNNFIKFLVEIIKKEQSDTVKRKHAIGALQKLSLRKQSQYWMFDYDIIYHTLMILKNQEKTYLSEYTLEYITALIMNLSLSSRGKDALANNKELAFEVLFKLIEFPNDQIKTFTNGTFYSMFSRRELRDFAFELGIPQKLPDLLKNADERFKKQIEYMIKQLQSNDDDYDSSQLEEDNDVDDLEDEEECAADDDEDDEDQDNMIVGEDLLRKEFGLHGEEAEKQKVIMDSIVLKELQQRTQQEQLRESQLEKLPVGYKYN